MRARARHVTLTYTKTVSLSCYFPEDWEEDQIEELAHGLLASPAEAVENYVADQAWNVDLRVARSAQVLPSDPDTLSDEDGVFVLNDLENDLVIPAEASWWWEDDGDTEDVEEDS